MYAPLRSSGEGPKNLVHLGFKDPKDITYFLREPVEDARIAAGHTPLTSRGLYSEGTSNLGRQSNPNARFVFISGDPVYDEGTNSVKYQVKVITGKNTRIVSESKRNIPIPSQPAAQMAYSDITKALSILGIPGNIKPEIVGVHTGYFVIATVVPDTKFDVKEVDDKLAVLVKQLNSNGSH